MPERKKQTFPSLFKKVADNEPITMLTCYDYPTAHFQEQAGIDMILVGDSLGMTMLGNETPLPVTMEDMIRHAQVLRRGATKAPGLATPSLRHRPGAGPHPQGQLLIYHDMFGLYPRFKPRMAKVFGDAGKVILDGLKAYAREVGEKAFPQPENWFGMPDEEHEELLRLLGWSSVA